MQSRKSSKIAALGFGTAMAAAMLSGCAVNSAPRADISAGKAQDAMERGRHERAVQHAEAAVQAEPHNAAYRAMLGQAYLDAGRFASAETSFRDAMALGENSARTALSLALALTAQADYDEAAAILNDWDGQIADADLGLALALSGQPERGIHIMTNAIRRGDNTPKMRQNLAYAYAVAGRWRDARLMAQEDIPAGEVGHRLAEWAEMASASAYQRRIANLLQVPEGVHDAGQPVHLALANNPSVEQLAAEANALATPEGELAAIEADTAKPLPVVATAQANPGEPEITLASYEPAKTEAPTNFATAFATQAPAGASLAQVTQDTLRFVSEPVVQTVPVRNGAVPSRSDFKAKSERPARVAGSTSRNKAAATGPVEDGTHLIQLGSFLSEQGARRAWGIYVKRHPELAGHKMVITQAIVRGKTYFRVSADGFDRSGSKAMCSQVNSKSGDGCISWAAASPLPGAVDTGVRLARR